MLCLLVDELRLRQKEKIPLVSGFKEFHALMISMFIKSLYWFPVDGKIHLHHLYRTFRFYKNAIDVFCRVRFHPNLELLSSNMQGLLTGFATHVLGTMMQSVSLRESNLFADDGGENQVILRRLLDTDDAWYPDWSAFVPVFRENMTYSTTLEPMSKLIIPEKIGSTSGYVYFYYLVRCI